MTVKPPLLLERFLPYRLNVLAAAVSQALAEVYETRYGIAIPEWRVLATLGQFGRMTARDIGQHSHMHKTKVSRAIAVLTVKDLVLRAHNDEDRREAFVTLTAAGRAAYRDLAPRALAFERQFLSTLSAAERAQLDRLLDKLAAASLEKSP